MVLGDADLAAFVRRHRVHYEVMPEAVIARDRRTTVGFEVRLFAIHDKGAKALPGCPKCHELLEGLSSLARSLLPTEERPTLIDIEPFDPIPCTSLVREESGKHRRAAPMSCPPAVPSVASDRAQ